jgi:hypothetical protein
MSFQLRCVSERPTDNLATEPRQYSMPGSNGYEPDGHDQIEFVASPSGQCLITDGLARCEVGNGLEIGIEFVTLQAG